MKDNGVPLKLAMLCVDCEFIRELGEPACPRCGSTAVWPLEKFISESSRRKVMQHG